MAQRGVNWFLRMVLDAQAARKVEKEAQDALNKGTSPKIAVENLQKVNSETGLLGKAFTHLGGLIAAAFAISRVKDFAKEMFDLGTASQETGSKFSTTFGAATPKMQAFLDQWATLAGLNKTVARDFSATAGSIAQGMGLAQDASAGLSEQILRLAGDLTSFDNRPIEESFNAVIGGITGERDSLKHFGIILLETEVQQRALAQTGKAHAEELTAQEKALASLSLMYEKAGLKIGDLNATQKSTANQTRQLQAEFQNVKIEIAEKLLPTFQSLVGWLAKNEDSIAAAAKDAGERVLNLADFLSRLAAFGGKVIKLTVDVKTTVNGVGRDVEEYFQSVGWIRKVRSFAREHSGLTPEEQRNVDLAMGLDVAPLPAASASSASDAASDAAQAKRAQAAQKARADSAAAERAAAAKAAAADAAQKAQEEAARRERDRIGGLNDDYSAYFQSQDAFDAVTSMHTSLRGGDMRGPVPVPSVPTDQVADSLSPLQKGFSDFFDQVADQSAEAGGAMADSFSGAFGMLFTDIDNIGGAFDAMVKGFAQGLVGGIREAAGKRASADFISAIEETAKGISGLASGNPGAAAHFTSAAHFFEAGVAWSALAGASSAVMGSGGGGARSGGASSDFDPGSTRARESDPTGPQVVVYIDPLDPTNPAYQRSVYAAHEYATQRFGEGAKVSVRPMSARGR